MPKKEGSLKQKESPLKKKGKFKKEKIQEKI